MECLERMAAVPHLPPPDLMQPPPVLMQPPVGVMVAAAFMQQRSKRRMLWARWPLRMISCSRYGRMREGRF